MPVTPWNKRSRAGLARDITVILTCKALALLALKLIWFSDPPAPSAEQVRQTVLGATQPAHSIRKTVS